ncbi:MAG: chorismate synthase [Candidatus Gastranaerophilales bacterium]
MQTKFRYLTAGESHGKCLTAIIEGVPAGFDIDEDFINSQLKLRQQGYGRGGRMLIEFDRVEITAGVRFGKSTGAPISLVIQNADFANWEKVMSVNPKELTDEKSFTTYRPGHADFAGSEKYGHQDLRNVLERSSARKTAIEVAVGAVAQLVLNEFNIVGSSKVVQVGCACDENGFCKQIDEAKTSGDTLGGKIKIVYENMPIGLGSYVHFDRKIDGILAQAVMSIPAVKSVTIGVENVCECLGSEYHDEFLIKEGKISRKTNNAGGVEGGMTNGEDLIIFAQMKPIPTLKKTLDSVDLKTMQEAKAHFERSDTCAIEACAVVAQARVACVLVDEFLKKYGSDSLKELKNNYEK